MWGKACDTCPQGLLRKHGISVSRLIRLAADPNYEAWVVEGRESGRLLGFVAVHLCHPLVERAEKFGRDRGARRAMVCSGEPTAGEVAHRSYDSFGFERIGKRYAKSL